MREIEFVPGVVATPAAITIPASFPDIETIISAQIVRTLGSSTLDDHLAAAIQASVAVADHAAHGHNITTVAPAGAGLAMLDAAGATSLEAAAGGQIDTAAVDVLAAAQAHAFGAGVATVHTRTGTDPVVAAVPTRLTTRTFSLDVNTVLGDILSLMYLEVGERVLVS